MTNALGIIAYTGKNVFINGLESHRPLAALSYVGRYRLVDIPISNMTNSGLQHIHVYTNGNPKVLFDHIGSARHYNINNKHGHVSVIPAFDTLNSVEFMSDMNCYYQNLDEIEDDPNDYVIIAPANWIYKANFENLLEAHIESKADMTILYHHFDNLTQDGTDSVGEKISRVSSNNMLNAQMITRSGNKLTSIERYEGAESNVDFSMDTYILSKAKFIELIEESHNMAPMFWLTDLIRYKLENGTLNVNVTEYSAPVFPIFNRPGYFDANMEMLKEANMAFFNDSNWPIYTRTNDSCPTIYLEGGSAQNALISNGCEVAGEVVNSILGRGVKIGKGARIYNCIILPDAEIGENVMLTNAIVDKGAKVLDIVELTGYESNPYYVSRREKL